MALPHLFNHWFGFGDTPETIYFAFTLWVIDVIIYILVIVGCQTVPMRFFYIAKCGDARYGFTGICGQDGASCTSSLIHPALQVAFDVGSQQNLIEILKQLQNDSSFIVPTFALFFQLVAIFWVTVGDRGEKDETPSYYIWPAMIAWSGVGLLWTTAWNASFNGSILVDARTGCSEGVLVQALLWIILLIDIPSAITVIHVGFVIVQKGNDGAKKLWKAKYLALVTPKDKIIQEIILPDGRRVDGSTQRVQNDALRWNV